MNLPITKGRRTMISHVGNDRPANNQPNRQYWLTDRLSLVNGDMFFSQMQTLIIPVNTVGVMGRGMALRAKQLFPHVYVVYRNVCRNKSLQMGKPYLYKSEDTPERDWADEPFNPSNPNSNKWFLLFPTKNHWVEYSSRAGIERGLQWLADNYKADGIQSLAIPALGCGCGGLDWKEIGPLVCKTLAQMNIRTSIYLPHEQTIDPQFLTREFLLKPWTPRH